MAYGKLSEGELQVAITQTKEAIQRGKDLLNTVAERASSKEVERVEASTPLSLEKLENELAKRYRSGR